VESAGLGATAPIMAFSLEELRSKLRGSSLAEMILYMGWKRIFHPIYIILFYDQIFFLSSSTVALAIRIQVYYSWPVLGKKL
jgi:hypothetical protein